MTIRGKKELRAKIKELEQKQKTCSPLAKGLYSKVIGMLRSMQAERIGRK